MVLEKKINLNLVGLDGNAFSLIGAFKNQARKEKWSKEEIDSVMNEAMSGDYDHLVATLNDHCVNKSDSSWDEEGEWDTYDEDDDE